MKPKKLILIGLGLALGGYLLARETKKRNKKIRKTEKTSR